MIFSSSCATYGVPALLPIDEATPQAPINPYGKTKLMAEHMLADYAAAFALNYVSLRYFNACGADPEGDLGEWHDPETHLIPRALMAAAGRIPHLEIFGEDYDTRTEPACAIIFTWPILRAPMCWHTGISPMAAATSRSTSVPAAASR